MIRQTAAIIYHCHLQIPGMSPGWEIIITSVYQIKNAEDPFVGIRGFTCLCDLSLTLKQVGEQPFFRWR